mmetsp:Transcript_100745/g.310599  ORF Transcript_100745/g.310599 Transcript_100745/m.310599 type:complete len:316 (-) Transcript_100745:294-1241(-)
MSADAWPASAVLAVMVACRRTRCFSRGKPIWPGAGVSALRRRSMPFNASSLELTPCKPRASMRPAPIALTISSTSSSWPALRSASSCATTCGRSSERIPPSLGEASILDSVAWDWRRSRLSISRHRPPFASLASGTAFSARPSASSIWCRWKSRRNLSCRDSSAWSPSSPSDCGSLPASQIARPAASSFPPLRACRRRLSMCVPHSRSAAAPPSASRWWVGACLSSSTARAKDRQCPGSSGANAARPRSSSSARGRAFGLAPVSASASAWFRRPRVRERERTDGAGLPRASAAARLESAPGRDGWTAGQGALPAS